ncbi:cob(I)yrinic acid a,c-diamide adenosyltransferase [Henriciella sp.]|uniref:cob(I)yrinic acid a,c-diamide adenosyltransferase n=1 Tax=Henriciella sp. TaxID=1968823 RepID=UPI0017EA8DD3|nr:cob(I)yrinic acid a,c-diamide adenosyltransferase [Henriciella sp.]HIG22459.1 cob(I)yrinic acid a,c-diamide adenosyltransferase [Henriciella sp.]
MVKLDKIYTRTGDKGKTRLATGEPVDKWDARVTAYGSVDEVNAALGVAVLSAEGEMKAQLQRIQNDLFDLGADLATPERDKPLGFEPLRVVAEQTKRLEAEIDAMNAELAPLDSFVLPGGTPLAAQLHVCRTICRRAERDIAKLVSDESEIVSEHALTFINRLSDWFFVASRFANEKGEADIKWKPGANR